MTARDAGPAPGWPGEPAAIGADAVDFGALGHMLGNTCCWGGRTRRFYSVAQHALTVCAAVQALGGLEDEDRRRLALHALLADAWRAWLPEPAGAVRAAKSAEKHARDRAAVQRAVLEAAGVEPELPGTWAQALGLTRRMAEAALVRDLSDAGIDRGAAGGGPLFPPLKERTRPLRPEKAAERWIEVLEGLRRAAPAAAESSAPGLRAPATGGEG